MKTAMGEESEEGFYLRVGWALNLPKNYSTNRKIAFLGLFS